MSISMKSRNRQSGAVLYVAMIMLILLALIGIVALQIAGLQQRMSSNYQATNGAFQNAEASARGKEIDLKAKVESGVSPATNLPPNDCGATPFDPLNWTDAANPHVQRLDLCFSWGAMDMSVVSEDERTDQIYQITAFNRDRPLLPTSEAIVNTVFIP